MPADVIKEIAHERARQIDVKGWSPAHDDTHDRAELAFAAASFLLRATSDHGDTTIFAGLGLAPLRAERNCGHIGLGGLLWPWTMDFPYDTPRRARLVKAAALIVAEIERLDRAGGTDAR